MDELTILTRQEPGIAEFNNFEEIKDYLDARLEVYRNLVYSEDSLKTAKEDKATLNKLRKARNLPGIDELPADFDLELIREYRREFLGEGQLFFLYKRLNRANILYSTVDAVAEKVYTFPLPITETEAAQRNANK